MERVHEFSKLDEDLNFFDKGKLFLLPLDEFIETLILRNYDADLKLVRDKESLREHDVTI